MEYIFGPVPSRRLGRSLGIDLAPFKTCSYDCIYCQLGRTTVKTAERRELVPVDDIVEQLKPKLPLRPDYITLGGSGEPTLHSRIGELIGRIKSLTDIPVAVLTNGSLLWREELRRELLEADLVIPSLDAGNAKMFAAVNRPHESIGFELMLEGLVDFGRAFKGEYWLEIFLMAGHNAIESEVRMLADCAARICPKRVQLNTVTRPPAEDYAMKVERPQLQDIAKNFQPPAEVIADYRNVHAGAEFKAGGQALLEMLKRRPCTLDDIAAGLGMHKNEALKYIEEFMSQGLLSGKRSNGTIYYTCSTSQA